jgi:hypothetical protein
MKTLGNNSPGMAQTRRKRRETDSEKTGGVEAGECLRRSPGLSLTLIPSLEEDLWAWSHKALIRRSRRARMSLGPQSGLAHIHHREGGTEGQDGHMDSAAQLAARKYFSGDADL